VLLRGQDKQALGDSRKWVARRSDLADLDRETLAHLLEFVLEHVDEPSDLAGPTGHHKGDGLGQGDVVLDLLELGGDVLKAVGDEGPDIEDDGLLHPGLGLVRSMPRSLSVHIWLAVLPTALAACLSIQSPPRATENFIPKLAW